MSLTETALAVALAAAVVALVWALRRRRDLARRVAALADRLGAERVPPDAGSGVEESLMRAEQGAASLLVRVDELTGAAARLAEALSRVSEAVLVCDESGEVVYRNRRAQEYVGSRHAEALAGEAVSDELSAALAGGTATRTLELFGPPRRTLRIAASPLEDGARLLGAVAVVEDISERRRLEAVRRDFVANISHELKTPVGALGLLAETLIEEEDPATVRRFAVRMQAEALRVGRIIDDLLDLSRIEAEEAPQRDVVAVHLLVAEAVERARPLAERRRVTVEASEAEPEVAVLGDRRQLVSAIHNLVENAVKYSDDGSTVRITAGAGADDVIIAVSDEGIGIPERDLERIFERFYRVDRARARDTGGTGLGLSIVRHVAGKHAGEVTVTSREGAGSTFTLRLPRVCRPAPDQARTV